MLRPKGGPPTTMFDYESEFVTNRMERERAIKALALSAAAGARRRRGLRAGPHSGFRAGLAARLARLAPGRPPGGRGRRPATGAC